MNLKYDWNAKLKSFKCCIWAPVILTVVMTLAEAQAAKSGERFGNWFYNCDLNSQTSKSSCYISQTSEAMNKNNQKVKLVTANIGYLFGDKKVWMVTLLPLRSWHLDLQKSVTLDVDGVNQLSGKVDTCFESGCRARFPLDRKTATALIRGKEAGLSFELITGKPIRLRISLKGLTKAMRAL